MRKPSMKTARDKADRAMSIYIRTKYAVDGYVKCVSCDEIHPINEMDAAHYIPRGKAATRFTEENVHPACQSCNRFRKEHHMRIYTLWMIDNYGRPRVDALEVISRAITRYRVADYEEIEADFKEKLRELS